MSKKTTTSGDQCSTTTCCAWKLAAGLLLLRLCLGTHFFVEGTSKLSYDNGSKAWSLDPDFLTKTERVFRTATGPFADFYKSQLPGFYDWENLLAVPRQHVSLSEEERFARVDWLEDYSKRRAQAAKEKKPLPFEFPAHAAYKPWAEKIVEGLRSKQKAFTDLTGINEEQDTKAADLLVARQQQLADFLAEESEAIEEYQHELWRLKQLESKGGSGEIPFRQERVAAKRSEAIGLGSRLVNETRGIERGFNNDLRALLTDEQRENASLVSSVEKAITSPLERRFRWMNIAATCLTLGVGVCLLLGLFTKLAAWGGILFLISVMVTQLPWVPGANTMYFYYQLVECAALLALAVSTPGKLPGIDYLFRGLCCRCSGAKGK